jgi:hypothetical protein
MPNLPEQVVQIVENMIVPSLKALPNMELRRNFPFPPEYTG